LETPKNQVFRKMRKFPMEGKKTWEKLINSICEEAGHLPSMLGKETFDLLVVMNTA
jgi:hypothetical protein